MGSGFLYFEEFLVYIYPKTHRLLLERTRPKGGWINDEA